MSALRSPFASLRAGQVAPRLQAIFDDLASRELFSGAAALICGDEVVWSDAYGLADRNAGVANTTATRFNIGSINKMWTALAVFQLAEAGRLSLGDAVSAHLGQDWLAPDVAATLRLSHLLNHTSGLGNYFTADFEAASRRRFRDLVDYQPLVRDRRPAFPPGSASAYSDIGFLLAGAIIENVSGDSYFDHIRRQITGPLGMSDSEAFDLEGVNTRLATGYHRVPLKGDTAPLDPAAPTSMSMAERFGLAQAREEALMRDGFAWRNNLFMHVVKGGPAGGYFSTIADLQRFAAGLRAHALVRPETWKVMTQGTPQNPSLGSGVMVEPGVIGHSGNFPGLSAQFSLYDDGHTLIVLANTTNSAGIATATLIRDLASPS